MDGLLNLNKPAGISSAAALYRVRRLLGQRKSGHTGTLDPAADGVLVIGLGRGTRLTESLMDQPKEYRAVARLDVTSSSYDADRPLEPVPVTRVPTEVELRAALAGFVGEIQQVPPAVSAIKIGGRPAYELERAGRVVTLGPRWVTVYALEVVMYAWPALTFTMRCGRGTYVRSLIRDLGAALGVGGCLTGLTRTAVGPFRIADAWTLERLADQCGARAERPEALGGSGLPPCVISLDAARALLAPPAGGAGGRLLR